MDHVQILFIFPKNCAVSWLQRGRRKMRNSKLVVAVDIIFPIVGIWSLETQLILENLLLSRPMMFPLKIGILPYNKRSAD